MIERNEMVTELLYFLPNPAISTKCLRCLNTGYTLFINNSFFMLLDFIEELNLKFILNKMLKVSYVRNSGQKHPVSYKHKENKRNCKNFYDIGFIISKNVKLKYP